MLWTYGSSLLFMKLHPSPGNVEYKVHVHQAGIMPLIFVVCFSALQNGGVYPVAVPWC